MSDRGAGFWDSEIVARTHSDWMAHPLVREHLNRMIGGGTPMWPFDVFREWLGGRRFKRALSIGCGGGALEREAIRQDFCDHIDAFDGSIVSLAVAQSEARTAGIAERISYFAADFNDAVLPRYSYDLVFFHQSAHHVSELERLFAAILEKMTADGVLYLDEFVGPSRDTWTRAKFAPQRRVYDALPRDERLQDLLLYPVQADDPSEAVRSGEILEQVDRGFEIALRRDYGGTLLSAILPQLRTFSDDRVRELIAEERSLLGGGAPSYYTLVIARPKQGAAKNAALGAYARAAKTWRPRRFARKVVRRLFRRWL